MAKKHAHKAVILELRFGDMPVAQINATLDMELDQGVVKMTGNAQKHAAKRHPKDYPLCLPFVSQVVNSPLYIGDDFKNGGKIELVGRPVGFGQSLLVAVEVTKDANGEYEISSFYPISETKVQGRREKGFLKVSKTN